MQQKLLKALHWIIDILNTHHVRYNISGGFCAHLYDSTRPVNDIDIDIPEDDFEKIYNNVKDYVTFGPQNYLDEKWDLKRMVLNYFGQEIDLTGAYEQKIFNETTQQWLSNPTDFSSSKKLVVDGLEINVESPVNLVNYKKLLNGEHQKIDIMNVQEYISNQKSVDN